MQTSERGIGFITRHEGRVLRAYRCPAGVWTIGAGLTAASGVVTPTPGMVITEAEADRLLTLALRKYEARTARAMPGARQYEFDGGVSFDYNTGSIHRASWVPAWASGNRAAMRALLGQWVRGGGRVLPGLERRRADEANLIEYGDYGVPVRAQAPHGLARVTLDLTPAEIAEVREAFAALGFDPGSDPRGVIARAVRAFQEAHGLTVDAVLGRATLSTLQRRLDVRAPAAAGATTSAAGTAATAAPTPDWLGWADIALIVGGIAVLVVLAWRYRDVVAAKLHPHAPRLAAYLRSVK